jgi:sterol 24-C-methyltransferase
MAIKTTSTEEMISQDPVMRKLMHGKSSEERNAFMSMMKKNSNSHKNVTREYVGHWEANGDVLDGESARDVRKGEYMSLVNKYVTIRESRSNPYWCRFFSYYDLATDLYEEGWAQSFHFCRFAPAESFLQALARHEHYLAHRINITDSMTVLDVGCGVGKPAREIATFTGCNVVGLNNNAYQIERATAHAAREGLSDKVAFAKGDFMVRFLMQLSLSGHWL